MNSTMKKMSSVKMPTLNSIRKSVGSFNPAKKQCCTAWVEKFLWFCDSYDLEEDQKSAVAGSLLVGDAFQVYSDMPAQKRNIWSYVKEELLKCYPKTKISDHQARAKWDKMNWRKFASYEKLAAAIQRQARKAYPETTEIGLEKEKKVMFAKCIKNTKVRSYIIGKIAELTFPQLV